MPTRVDAFVATIAPWAGRAAIVIGLAAALALGLHWAKSGAAPERSVEQQWFDAVNELGVEPVYPPTEDFVVGDILAMVTQDLGDEIRAAKDLRYQPIGNRVLKLVHLDMTAEIEQAYRETYQFPPTSARPPAGDQIWPQTSSAESLFKTPTTRQSLPIVVFPNFTLRRSRSANGSAGRLAQLWNATFGGFASSDEVMDVRFAGTETYGLPAIVAEAKLIGFCTADATAFLCSDDQLRKQLSLVVGADIYQTYKNRKTGEERPRMTVELALINRVFLARGIETRSRNANQVRGNLGGAGTQPQTPPAPGANARPGDTGTPSQPTQPGLAASFEDASSMDVTVPSTTLARPVVIGFKSVRWTPQSVQGAPQ